MKRGNQANQSSPAEDHPNLRRSRSGLMSSTRREEAGNPATSSKTG